MLNCVIVILLILFTGIAPVTENIAFKALMNKSSEPNIFIHPIRYAHRYYQLAYIKLSVLDFVPPVSYSE